MINSTFEIRIVNENTGEIIKIALTRVKSILANCYIKIELETNSSANYIFRAFFQMYYH